MLYTTEDITAIILAGGQGKRLNYINKGLLDYQSKPMISHIIESVKPNVKQILVSANQDIHAYQQFGFPVITDDNHNFQGPLAGILSCEQETKTKLIYITPCDTPFLPKNLCLDLLDSLNKNDVSLCVANDGNRLQNLNLLMHKNLISSIKHYFDSGNRKVNHWIKQQKFSVVNYDKQIDFFININTKDDLVNLNRYDKSNK